MNKHLQLLSEFHERSFNTTSVSMSKICARYHPSRVNQLRFHPGSAEAVWTSNGWIFRNVLTSPVPSSPLSSPSLLSTLFVTFSLHQQGFVCRQRLQCCMQFIVTMYFHFAPSITGLYNIWMTYHVYSNEQHAPTNNEQPVQAPPAPVFAQKCPHTCPCTFTPCHPLSVLPSRPLVHYDSCRDAGSQPR